jgi:hypothetical protein
VQLAKDLHGREIWLRRLSRAHPRRCFVDGQRPHCRRFLAERLLLRALAFAADLRILYQRQLIYNLSVDMPKGGPSALIARRSWVALSPVAGHDGSFDESKVVKDEDLVVFRIFLEVLYVKCITNAASRSF